MFGDIRHIFFDLDRTLWDFDKNSSETIHELFSELQLAQKGIQSQQEFLDIYISMNDYCWELYRQNKISQKELRSMRFKLAFEKFGLHDENLAQVMDKEYVERSPMKKGLLPHAKETLEKLSENYTLHIITNGFEEVQLKKIENTGIASFFKSVVTSERAGHKKPDPRIFDYALAVSHAQAYNSLMVGDDLAADIQGAQSAGMRAVHFLPQNQSFSPSKFTIAELPELVDILSA